MEEGFEAAPSGCTAVILLPLSSLFVAYPSNVRHTGSWAHCAHIRQARFQSLVLIICYEGSAACSLVYASNIYRRSGSLDYELPVPYLDVGLFM